MPTGETRSTGVLKNHLTEVLDSSGGGLYSQSTLQRAGRQAHRLQGARQRDGDQGPEAWLGRRAKASGSSPLKQAGTTLMKPPEPQRGAFLFAHEAPRAAAGAFLFAGEL